MKDLKNKKDIELLISTFYKKAMNDTTIGFFFTEVIPLNLEHHLPIMINFWNGILFGSQDYKGNPMQKHMEMDAIQKLLPIHFNRWLLLWEETVNKLFEGTKATEAITRAKSIAAIMEFKVNQQ